jgi:hypothetical protein
MANILFDRRHLKEYALWGTVAGLAYAIPVLIYLAVASYYYSATIFIGCMLFMFTVLAYSMKLTRRQPEYKSTWSMIIAGNMVVLAGIIVSVLLSVILCFVFIPGFMSGDSDSSFIRRAPSAMNIHNTSTLMLIAMTATLVNFGVGGVINIVVAYAVKENQTKDNTPTILQEAPKHS